MQEPGQSVSKQSMVREVQAGRLTDWDCTDMTHFMGTDCVFSGKMRMERLKDMFQYRYLSALRTISATCSSVAVCAITANT